jgi:hypothetical protein
VLARVAGVSAAPRSGLGRGLAAILPTAESSEREQLSDHERVLHSLVDAGLDQLAQTTRLDLLAYLHLPRHDEPVLFLRTPALATLSPTRAYRLFARFSQASRSGANEGTFTQDGTVTVFFRTPGLASDGVHFVGRADAVIDQATLPALRATTQTYAAICNQYTAGVPADVGTPRLVVELAGDATTVHVVAGPDHGEGRATAVDPMEAVVRAVLAASPGGLTFVDAREVLLGTARAVLVVLAAADGTPRPGFVVSEDDLLQATATATRRAVTGR